MSLLISEESMIPTSSAAQEEEKGTAAEPSLAQQVDEVKGQTIALRTDIARTAASLRKTVVVTGAVAALVVVLAMGFGMVRLSSSASVRGVGVATAAPEMADDRATAQLSDSVAELRSMVNRIMERPAQPVAQKNADRPAAALADCSKLPADAASVSVDFSIPFQVGSAKLSRANEVTLDNVAKLLVLAPDRCVLIEGHSDISGTEEKNIALSLKRATAVADYLAGTGGIERRRLVPLGKGSSGIAEGMNPADPQNRRVLFKVITG